MRCAQGSDVRPLTCAQPVMPGRTARRPRSRSVYCATCDGQRRARADDRHLAAEHVDEVGQLVERRAAQQPPDPGDARVAGVDREAGADVLGAGDHRAQLEHLELAAVAADAALAVDRPAARLEADGDDRECEHRRGRREHRERHDDVEGAAAHQRVPSAASQPAGVPWRSQSHSPAATEAVVST